MNKTKDKPINPCAPSDAEIGEQRAEQKAWEEHNRELRQLYKVIADIAGIRKNRDAFCETLHLVLCWLAQEAHRQIRHNDTALIKAEDALRAANDAVHALSQTQKVWIGMHLFCNTRFTRLLSIPEVPTKQGIWADMMPMLVTAIANVSGSDPSYVPRIGRGRREGTKKNLVLRSIVRALVRMAHAYGGHLSFNSKEETGGDLGKALTLLGPHMGSGMVPRALPNSTIERIVTAARKEAKKDRWLRPGAPPHYFT
jgi:hypothetical protein